MTDTLPTDLTTTDTVLPFEVLGLNVRGRLVRLDTVVSTVLDRHDYPPLVSRFLAEALGVTAALGGAALKQDGSILSFQMSGEGPISLCVADYVAPGILRGYARFDPAEVALLADSLKGALPSLKQAMGKGHLVLTLDHAGAEERYQGIVELLGETVTECVTSYFQQSEQTLSHVMSSVEAPTADNGWRVGVLMVQRIPRALPGAAETESSAELAGDDDQWQTAMALMNTVTPGELTSETDAPRLIHNLFHDQNYKLFADQKPEFGCRCSREKVITTLSQFPLDEVEEMAVDGRIVVNCQFCNASYMFTEDQVATFIQEIHEDSFRETAASVAVDQDNDKGTVH